MSNCTHSICNVCWLGRNPGMEPYRIRREYRSTDYCCFCGERHESGIYVREDPAKLTYCHHQPEEKEN